MPLLLSATRGQCPCIYVERVAHTHHCLCPVHGDGPGLAGLWVRPVQNGLETRARMASIWSCPCCSTHILRIPGDEALHARCLYSVPLFGAFIWCLYSVPLFGAFIWCLYLVPLFGAFIRSLLRWRAWCLYLGFAVRHQIKAQSGAFTWCLCGLVPY